MKRGFYTPKPQHLAGGSGRSITRSTSPLARQQKRGHRYIEIRRNKMVVKRHKPKCVL